MPLQERLINEMKEAMRSGDKNKVSVIRMVRSSLKNKEIE
ncbi:MAG: GatB/YqeY domain-containing protein, partial [Nitrospirota bacterium]